LIDVFVQSRAQVNFRRAAIYGVEIVGTMLVLAALAVFFIFPSRSAGLGDSLLASGLLLAWLGDST
jgi:hypothetical protein